MSTGCVSDMVFVDVPKTGTGSASNWWWLIMLLISRITITSSRLCDPRSRLGYLKIEKKGRERERKRATTLNIIYFRP